MQIFKIAAAQISSAKGDVEENIKRHVKAIDIAAKEQVSLIFFPELSLTGYEPELASSLAFTSNDPSLSPLISAASTQNMLIIVGAPLKLKEKFAIGSIIIHPDNTVTTYAKMNLHPGEEKFFIAGDEIEIIEVHDHKVALAICADTNNPQHVQRYVENGATIYAASVLITEGGYALDTEKLESYATQHKLLVTMANHNAPTGGWLPTGKSAAWSAEGLLAVTDCERSSLVISQQVNHMWESTVIEIN